MKKLLIIPLLGLCSYVSYEPVQLTPIKPIETKPIERTELIQALIMVESSGNNSAYNEKEDAVGCLQIRRVMVKDVNRILKQQGKDKQFKLKDRWDCDKAVEIFETYTNYYHPEADNETIARVWNGGPKGHEKQSTKQYWDKVQRHINVK